MSLEDVQLVIPPELAQQLRKVFLCGNYGDPGMAPQCLEVVQYLLACNPKLKVGVHTNGGMRTSGWWRDLGKVLRAPSYCRFAIDGLEDTNHLYRQRVSWSKLMRNVTAFVGAGGNAEWDFLVFRHNEHQVEAARQLSVSLGFSRFQVKSTARFLHRERAELLEGFEVRTTDGGVSHVLRPPEDPQYRNVALEEDAKRLLERYGSMEAYFDSAAVTTTSCKSSADKDVYVSAERLVFPCCWLAGHIYNTMADSRRQVFDVLSDRGLSIEDIRVTEEQSVTDIASGPFFDGVAESWGRGSVAAGKVRTCAMMCGRDLQPFAKQFLTAQQHHPGGAGSGNDAAACADAFTQNKS